MKKKLELKEIDALRAAKLALVLSVVLAVLFLVLGQITQRLIIGQISSDLGPEFSAKYAAQLQTTSLSAAIIQVVVGWVSALVICFVYNILARKFGGLIFIIEEDSGI